MSDVPVGPPGFTPSACAGTFCAPGSKDVTVTASNCKTGDALGGFAPFTIQASTGGQIVASQNGFALICCALPGFKFTVGATGFVPKSVTLTGNNVQSQSVQVCLDPVPPPTTPPSRTCMVHSLASTDEFQPSRRALAPYYWVRDVVASTPRGKELIDLYYDPDTKSRMFEIVQRNSNIRAEGLALIVELQPLISQYMSERRGLSGHGFECACGRGSDDVPLLSQDAALRAVRFLETLANESGAHELIRLTTEFLAASDRGLEGAINWLMGVTTPPP